MIFWLRIIAGLAILNTLAPLVTRFAERKIALKQKLIEESMASIEPALRFAEDTS